MSFIDEANSFYKSYCNADPWDIAPFSSIKKMENDTRGQFGEKIISEAFHLDSKILLTWIMEMEIIMRMAFMI